eukprot:TRINITY_DN41431_c0_g1_i1.p1 TRINITY_DN41431_c0_g1~~TRINITY_DN41431_c0_g1_i1.p1  ORF type:complete len:1559 (+),score=286.00 TRINITY_DN41431_c0_g1_i1:230-4678(+)
MASPARDGVEESLMELEGESTQQAIVQDWRLFTSSTASRVLNKSGNCWEIESLKFFASSDCNTEWITVPASSQRGSGVGRDLKNAFEGTGTTKITSKDGEKGATDVWVSAQGLRDVRCIEVKQKVSADSGCRPLSNLEIQVRTGGDAAPWQTVRYVPWSVANDGVNRFQDIDTSSRDLLALEETPGLRVLSCLYRMPAITTVFYAGVELTSLQSSPQNSYNSVSFKMEPGSYLTISGKASTKDFLTDGGFWADCGGVARGDSMKSNWQFYCTDEEIDQVHRVGKGDGWQTPSDVNLKKNSFGPNMDGVGEEKTACTFRLLPQKATFWTTLYSKGAHLNMTKELSDFNAAFRASGSGLVRRDCWDCKEPYREIYLKKKNELDTWDAYTDLMVTWPGKQGLGDSFGIYSTLADALAGTNGWSACDAAITDLGFPGSCGPKETSAGQWTSLDPKFGVKDFRFSVYTFGSRKKESYELIGQGMCFIKELKSRGNIWTPEACQALCSQDEDCVYVSHGGKPDSPVCTLYGQGDCTTRTSGECGENKCGTKTWRKQSGESISCAFSAKSKVKAINYGIDITNTVIPDGKSRKITFVGKPGKHLVITGEDEKGEGNLVAECSSGSLTWEAYCSDDAPDLEHSHGGGAGWSEVKELGASTYASSTPGKKYCAFRAMPVAPKPLFSAAWCRSATVSDNWPDGKNYPTVRDCAAHCLSTPSCTFYGFGEDKRMEKPRCATFAGCEMTKALQNAFNVYQRPEALTSVSCALKADDDIQSIFYDSDITSAITGSNKGGSVQFTLQPGSYLTVAVKDAEKDMKEKGGFWANCGSVLPASSLATASWESYCSDSDLGMTAVHRMGGGYGWKRATFTEGGAFSVHLGDKGKANCAFRASVSFPVKQAAENWKVKSVDGAYFMFDKESSPLAHLEQGPVTYAVVQCRQGRRVWSGQVVLWSSGRGARNHGASPGQWTENDVLTTATECKAEGGVYTASIFSTHDKAWLSVDDADDFVYGKESDKWTLETDLGGAIGNGAVVHIKGKNDKYLMPGIDGGAASWSASKNDMTKWKLNMTSDDWSKFSTNIFLRSVYKSRLPFMCSNMKQGILTWNFGGESGSNCTSWQMKIAETLAPSKIAPTFQLAGVGGCVGGRISYQPDTASQQACEDLCLADTACQAYSFCSGGTAEPSYGCSNFCALYQTGVAAGDGRAGSECYVKSAGQVTPSTQAAAMPEGPCEMDFALAGDASGSQLVATTKEGMYKDCSCLCLETSACKAIVYRASTGKCELLKSSYKEFFKPALPGSDALSSNKKCGYRQCPYRYWMLEVLDVNVNMYEYWHLAEIELKDDKGQKINVEPKRDLVWLLDGVAAMPASMGTLGTEAAAAFDGDLDTDVQTDPTYISEKDNVNHGRNAKGNKLAAKLVIDLKTSVLVKEINLIASKTKTETLPVSFKFKGSDDLTTWEVVADVDGTQDPPFPNTNATFGKSFKQTLKCSFQE